MLIHFLFFQNRVGIEIPTIEIRFEQLSIEADAYIASRALPTLLNSTLNALEVIIFFPLIYENFCMNLFPGYIALTDVYRSSLGTM